MTRREAIGLLATGMLAAGRARAEDAVPRFRTRGVVLYPFDLSLEDWPDRAARAGITTIGLHAGRRLDVLADFVRSAAGGRFLSRCAALDLGVEYEVHALGDLLSREWFASPDMDMFRMDASGARTPDYNCCPSSPRALEIIAEKAVAFGRALKPTTGRYYYWPDDGREWCHCPKCAGLSATEQAVLVENAIAAALRRELDPAATLSHISYSMTLPPPKSVRPHEALFLEFAPIARTYDRPIDDLDATLSANPPEPASHAGYLEILDANLAVFPRETAQVLEYWLDVSRFSGWKRPSVRIPWNPAVMRADAAAYARRGIRHATTFATWIDADHVRRFGDPPLAEYAAALGGHSHEAVP